MDENNNTVQVPEEGNPNLIYKLNDKPPISKLIVYGLQFVLIFIGSIILVPLIMGDVLGWDGATITFLLQCAIFTAGIATFVQSRGLGPIGSRLPILLGTTFVALAPGIAITEAYGFDSFIGAIIVGGIIYAIFGYIGVKVLRKIFTATVAGTVVACIGVTLVGPCADLMAGGGSPAGSGYGAWQNWFLSILTMVVCILFNQFGRGFIRTASIFIGLVIGYIVALFMGVVDFSVVAEAGWFAIPKPFAFGVSFDLVPILIMVVIYIVTVVEFIGDTTATAMISAGRLPTDKEMRGGILCDSLSSILSGIFNFAPNISYSDAIGTIGATGVGSRYAMVTASIMITIAGLLPKFAAILYTVPPAVLGGAAIILNGIIIVAGIEVMVTEKLTGRNLIIIGASLGVGIGFSTSGVVADAPMLVSVLCTGIPATALVGGLLNVILPKDKPEVKPDAAATAVPPEQQEKMA